MLVRMYKCPMWDWFKCGVSLRIQEGAFGMIMESLGSHNIEGHLDGVKQDQSSALLKASNYLGKKRFLK